MDKCIECDKPATWTRHTQFAGDHPYCTEHAEKESDFNENDSYAYWTMENILAGAEQQGDEDKNYEISTQEKYDEFVKKRNYHYTNTDNPIDFPEWDNWRPIKDL